MNFDDSNKSRRASTPFGLALCLRWRKTHTTGGDMAADCLFCKMISGEIKPNTVYENDEILAFRDINPQAPVHVLVIPKQHIATLNELTPGHAELVGKLTLAAQKVARDLGIADTGYRTVMNCNRDAGQSVWHVHLHLLGGRLMAWPPG
jgi:histidine triad (HIT) family protein